MRRGERSRLAADPLVGFLQCRLVTSPVTNNLGHHFPCPAAKSDSGAAISSPHDEAEEATCVHRPNTVSRAKSASLDDMASSVGTLSGVWVTLCGCTYNKKCVRLRNLEKLEYFAANLVPKCLGAGDVLNDNLVETIPLLSGATQYTRHPRTLDRLRKWKLEGEVKSELIRRVKCDEQKPSCARCTSTGRKCDGYTNMPVSRSGSRSVSPNKGMASSHSSLDPSQKIRLPTFDDAKQLQSFEFFINSTCTVSPVYYGADFWSTRVLQLSLSEPAIRYALCSLSTLHRSVKAAAPNGIRVIDDENKTYSLQQYTNAVNHTQKLLAESSSGSEEMVIKGLVACILFVC
ncbi:uncharacterized protein PAC_11983 [Phialocephala subalpina]|uniref:Zn(2)-C6 fungal-type domain-containing protein n=1 Tax=Phialocephala subalpina TaxID=576137 RepID=A0A1L7XAS0_9HELO|nr:uncharacterized protein PAC_11983 [Phialocephala subalpina]